MALLLLRYYLWRGTEGCAAASDSSSHVSGKIVISEVPVSVTSNTLVPGILLYSYCSKRLHLYPQASNCKGLRQFKLNPSHHFEFDTCYIRFVYTHEDDTIHFLKYDSI